MPIAITCHCGKTFNTIDEARGKAVRCPQCSKILRVPVKPPTAAEIARQKGQASRSQAQPRTFLVRCTCGKALKVRGIVGGEPVKCPGCGAMVELKPLPTRSNAGHPAPAKPKGLPCPICELPLELGAKVCLECGSNVTIEQQLKAISPDEEEARRKRIFLIGMSAAIISVVLWVVLTRH